jgi:hypothetical protein
MIETTGLVLFRALSHDPRINAAITGRIAGQVMGEKGGRLSAVSCQLGAMSRHGRTAARGG